MREAVVAGLENFLDVIGHAVADAGQFHELGAVVGELLDGFGRLARVRRRVRSCDNGR